MAKLQMQVQGRFDEILQRIERGIVSGSVSAKLEDGSDFAWGAARVSVRVFERYSMVGSNRVSLNVTLFQGEDGVMWLSGITSGGSQAVFAKINTVGEKAFLERLRKIVE